MQVFQSIIGKNTAVELIKELVKIGCENTGALDRKMALAVKAYLDGCDCLIETDTVEMGRHNVIATIPGQIKSPALVWICHMDTVMNNSNRMKLPVEEKVENGRIYGPGVCDMKSGVACAMSAFRKTARRVQKGDIELRHSLKFICIVGEAGDMKNANHLVDQGIVSAEDWIMDLEPTGGEIQIAHKGRFRVELDVHGMTTHASEPDQGADTIAAMAEIIARIRAEVREVPVNKELGRTAVTFVQIRGGYQPYAVPDECKLWIDFRLAPPVTSEKICKLVEDACAYGRRVVQGVKTEYKITGNCSYVENNRESVLLKGLKRAVYQVTGETKNVKVFPKYTDVAVIAERLGNKECLFYGPGDLKYAHKPDEFVEIKNIECCEKGLEQLIREML